MKFALIAFLLAGCALTPEQRADRMVERYGPTCSRLGYEPNSDKWRDCIVAQANAATMKPRAVVNTQ